MGRAALTVLAVGALTGAAYLAWRHTHPAKAKTAATPATASTPAAIVASSPTGALPAAQFTAAGQSDVPLSSAAQAVSDKVQQMYPGGTPDFDEHSGLVSKTIAPLTPWPGGLSWLDSMTAQLTAGTVFKGATS